MALQQQGSLSQAARCDRWILGWASSCLPLFCYLGRQKPSQHVCGKAPAQSEPHGEREEGGEEGRAVATLSMQSEQRLFLLACFPAGQTSFFKHALDYNRLAMYEQSRGQTGYGGHNQKGFVMGLWWGRDRINQTLVANAQSNAVTSLKRDCLMAVHLVGCTV